MKIKYSTKMRKIHPFLKWAGGKRWLVESGQYDLPNISGRYFEPFLGGGAVFFATQPPRSVLSDSNWRLIELYTVIRDNFDEFQKIFRRHASSHCKKYYYEIRSKQMRKPVTRAAQFLYLNRTCWNGLYRENLNGQFNVPIGTKENVVFETDNFEAWSRALRYAVIKCMDFEEVIDMSEKGDFIFVDPPYTVRHNMNGFVKYNQKIFAWQDQIRLRNALFRASERGVAFAMTNADHDSIRDLYCGFGIQRELRRHSVIAGRSVDRGPSTELLIVSS